ncbi:hypothetical protein [Blastococcus sp. CCUG 61487]|uniref:hypothetical protein n=1 Tax=Blastococcus sp. CCUG 61487 TaxID=1840703 RepID=UPI0010BFAF06|nr:hypothetical protein [Blastococcus sp. CCUG 61487]TKJ21491.1 hypothetical protein A6V29_07300 [Blastococcus sp. CCUG 61487]
MTTSASRSSGSGLLQRLRPVPVDVADLLEVAEAVLPALSGPRLRVDLVRRTASGTVVVLEEHERSLRVGLLELADELTRAGVAPTHDSIAAALVAWVDRRPVTDASAATDGVAVLDWTDGRRTSVGWRVVVRRGQSALPWSPVSGSSADDVRRTRAAALGRSREVDLALRVEGPVALWSHASVPILATTVLAAPDRMLARVVAAGLPADDVHVVVTPHRPVACAGRGVAARLSGETTEASVTLAWSELADLPWL